ncbi:MAG: RecO, partial [uncultured Gemmatimonadaceae bacterium]
DRRARPAQLRLPGELAHPSTRDARAGGAVGARAWRAPLPTSLRLGAGPLRRGRGRAPPQAGPRDAHAGRLRRAAGPPSPRARARPIHRCERLRGARAPLHPARPAPRAVYDARGGARHDRGRAARRRRVGRACGGVAARRRARLHAGARPVQHLPRGAGARGRGAVQPPGRWSALRPVRAHEPGEPRRAGGRPCVAPRLDARRGRSAGLRDRGARAPAAAPRVPPGAPHRRPAPPGVRVLGTGTLGRRGRARGPV